jgi:hypothetical protein
MGTFAGEEIAQQADLDAFIEPFPFEAAGVSPRLASAEETP